eukprot:GHVR01052959.1.p1 GENE.GHVR01052959.1~~GHVR01052959.1.p1  ORF type:complete len:1214 (+),score=291.38 GHVR01052959.1:63-3704(+)
MFQPTTFFASRALARPRLRQFDAVATRFFSAPPSRPTRPIKKLLIANRGEISVRISRACREMGIKSVAVYSAQDEKALHNQMAQESYIIGQKGKMGPIEAYLDIDGIVATAKDAGADAIHPGYGFLSENALFSEKIEQNGMMFVGPHYSVVSKMGDKVEARKIAISIGVPVIPGTEDPVNNFDDALRVAKEIGFPVMFKAAFGGGGRGMRRVLKESEAKDAYDRATSEALSAFGNAQMFVEKLIEDGRHIEIQVFGDKSGDVVHLFERDCTVQRRHQKVVEIAPAPFLNQQTKLKLYEDAVRLAKSVGYENAGTVEFLVDKNDRHYFIEVNPRIQVEHTVTEEITGVDIVKTQIAVREGQLLKDIGLTQDKITCSGCSIQLRVTSEDSQKDFLPSAGRIDRFRAPGGIGIRVDGAVASSGALVTPHYDSLISKVIANGNDFTEATIRSIRAIEEMRVDGISTNIPFLHNVLNHPLFTSGDYTTRFIDEHPSLKVYDGTEIYTQQLLQYLANLVVNGPMTPLVNKDLLPSRTYAFPPQYPGSDPSHKALPDHVSYGSKKHGRSIKSSQETVLPLDGWKQVLTKKGPKEFAKSIRDHKQLLITDTTMRDAHQSLFATRMRTYDMLKGAPATSHLLHKLFSLENWGGATFDVAYRFLRESPWVRLEQLREAVPNIPFQMLLRGANAVGYTAYPDNAVEKFCTIAVNKGMDIFRVFDSLNYIENLKLGIHAVGQAGGVVEATISYTGNIADPNKKPYTLEYYLNLARELNNLDIHILGIKDMAGLLTPTAATILIGALRKEFPNLPIHLHTHDTGGTGVATCLAAAHAGADIVDTALDAMSGLTSQPSMGAVVAGLQGTQYDTQFDLNNIGTLCDYWELARGYYAPFECTATLKSGGSDVYLHEIPGGQYTNLHMQAHSLGLGDKWAKVKKAYAEANELCGNIIKVTPSSKVVGDLAQFMVQNELNGQQVKDQIDDLNLPSSVVEYFQGQIGIPPFGFPEAFRDKVLKGKSKIEGRPGKDLKPVDWDDVREKLTEKFRRDVSEAEMVSWIMYPQVFEEYIEFRNKFGDVSKLPTPLYLCGPLQQDPPFKLLLSGNEVTINYLAKSPIFKDGSRDVYFEVNGLPSTMNTMDNSAHDSKKRNVKASTGDPKEVGAPMPGTVLSYKVKEGQEVEKGDALVVISAMKMETIIVAPCKGIVASLPLKDGEHIEGGDLLIKLQ